MRISILCFLLLQVCLCHAQKVDLNGVRKNFNQGVKNKELCERYHDQLQEGARTPIEKGYKAAFHMFMAKHTSNPIKKMSYFKNAKNMLEDVIEANPQEVELRFIRLCIQYYSPKYLGYHSDVEKDKTFVMNNLHKMSDKQAKQLIFNYLDGANMYTDSELALLGR
ncbi:hypothetical protein M8998_04470 [Sphingobacterium sp. lm-10]|uniref:hypothetical protein n=1 Tax=Sphingobacterium sp. lm-10 TaxID=2944904 RepID=UPI002021ACA3|nr:hypothetical protein [Sphingobacterium sp. lm-10]MCL7987193.1 hypothetical protein [Sphingobacterium sp. lm-10]